jgi:hypothetical protein
MKLHIIQYPPPTTSLLGLDIIYLHPIAVLNHFWFYSILKLCNSGFKILTLANCTDFYLADITALSSKCMNNIFRPEFDSRRYQIFREVMGLERGPLSLVSTIEELLEIKSNGSCLENRNYGQRDPSRWPRGTLYPQQLTLTSSTSGGRSNGVVRPRTQAMEFSLVCSTRVVI